MLSTHSWLDIDTAGSAATRPALFRRRTTVPSSWTTGRTGCRQLESRVGSDRSSIDQDSNTAITDDESVKSRILQRTSRTIDLIARLCAMIPPPGFHMLRFHGVLSSHARLRSEVVPEPPADDSLAAPPRQLELFQDNEELRLVRRPWAWLVKHVFLDDVSVCPKCS
ncbi:MAG: hypothetical protein EXR75_06635, partial [Myxococcales bacterium]|nr:hypothetical protein [Myxococcales bacterium]